MEKLLCFLATEKGYETLRRAVSSGKSGNIGAVISYEERNVQKSYFYALQELCQQKNLPFYQWAQVKTDLAKVIKDTAITAAIAISWQYLLPLSLNQYLKIPLIVFHDALLPQYRGFAPTPTAIMCGETRLGISLLFATNEVDKGDIILQKEMFVTKDMYIDSVIKQLTELYSTAFEDLLDLLDQGNIRAVPQDESKASYSIWRSPEDCHINWSLSAEAIYNMIRAVGYPYPGAYTYDGEQKIYIDKAETVGDLPFAIRMPGKIWSLAGGSPTVICGQGMLRIIEAKDASKNPYVFNKVRVQFR